LYGSSAAGRPISRRASLAPPTQVPAPSVRRASTATTSRAVGGAISTGRSKATKAAPSPHPQPLAVARQDTPMPASKSCVSTAPAARIVRERPKMLDFNAIHNKEFNKKEGINEYVTRMRKKLDQSKSQQPKTPAPAAMNTTSILSKKRKEREESEKENHLSAANVAKRARASIALPHVVEKKTAEVRSQPTTPTMIRKRRLNATAVSHEDLSSALSVAAISSPARVLVSPMRLSGTRAVCNELLLADEAKKQTLSEISVPLKRQKTSAPDADALQMGTSVKREGWRSVERKRNPQSAAEHRRRTVMTRPALTLVGDSQP